MTWSVTADPVKFSEALDFFSSRFLVTEEIKERLGDYAGPRAWTIAGVTQLEIVQYVHDSLEHAIESGIPFEEWQAEVGDQLTAAWGRRDSARMQTVFINATQQSYSAGRWEQMQEVKDLRPFGLFDGVVDSRQSQFCKAWDGKILPIDEFAHRGAVPQCHHRCRSQIRSLRPSDAAARGGVSTTLPSEKAADGFGQDPTKSAWKPDPNKYDPTLFAEYERKRSDLEENADRPLEN